MQAAKVVIGANYGDEGKGLLTDYLAAQDPERSIVVRFNGGAQAGHTVQCPDGRRHVFSHFGAGSFVGAPSFLSRFFIVNPLLFARELSCLADLDVQLRVLIEPQAYLTTPVDMFINRVVELRRGSARHGSCGVGINETVTRCTRSPRFCTRVEDLLDLTKLHRKLSLIAREWLPGRLSALGFAAGGEERAAFAERADAISCRFVEDAASMLERIELAEKPPCGLNVIFEGAQGLMLDEARVDQWPHVTRSRTGLDNVVYLARKFELESLDVIYATRTYLTRHGAGPLNGECEWAFPDATNVTNQFQGQLRFAPLDVLSLERSIAMDLARARRSFPAITASLAVTCADQLPFAVRARTLGSVHESRHVPVLTELPLPVSHISYGPTRNDVRKSGVLSLCSR